MLPTPVKNDRCVIAEEQLRNRERAVVSRRLHDDIGPTLCAVGLHLGLLKSALRDAPSALESLTTIESALADAIQGVRGLSYRTDPGIVARCGLRSALSYLCQDAGVAFEEAASPRAFSQHQAETIFRIAAELILDASEVAPSLPLRLQMTQDGLILHAGVAAIRLPSEATAQALSPLMLASSVRIESRQESGEVVVTAMSRDERI